MRVALCFSGAPRTWKSVYNSISENLIKPHNADVFLHVWYQESPQEQDELLSAYCPKMSLLEKDNCIDLPRQYERQTPGFSSYNTFSMYKSIWMCNSIKSAYENEEGFRYDWVIRMRYDLLVTHHFDLANMDNKLLYVPSKHCSHSWNTNQPFPRIVCDTYALSNSDVMNMYSSVYLNINRFYLEGDEGEKKNGKDSFEATAINGEHMLAMQLKRCKMNHLLRYAPTFQIVRQS